MVPFSNHYVEKELAKMGMEVDRWMNVSNSVLHNPSDKIKDKIKGYCEYNMGATCMMTIERALHFAQKKYDGIIHVKSFGCTPEIDVIPVLQNISADYKIPIIYLSYDSQTSETGIKTRLEAFYDMVIMRKESK
jgi:predicted nucleotide-binding protein (sugar kinase/HSP70/actin superfamily)